MATRRSLSDSEIARAYDLLGLTDQQGQSRLKHLDIRPTRDKHHAGRYTTWISNGSEPIKVGRVRNAKLEGFDRRD